MSAFKPEVGKNVLGSFWLLFACQALVFAAGFLKDSRVFVSALSSWMVVTCSYPRSLQLSKEWEEKMPKIQTEQDLQTPMVYKHRCF